LKLKKPERGYADHLLAQELSQLSFADHYDPKFMQFGPLRVITNERSPWGRIDGFQHLSSSRIWEIISYVLDGTSPTDAKDGQRLT
jgi:hypothetical protein